MPGRWIASLTCCEFLIAWPFTRTTTSPDRRPACFAGLECTTWSTFVVTLNCGGPDQKKAVRITTAASTLAKGPAPITTMRRQTSARQ